MNSKKAKKSFCPRASTGNTHHGMRYAGEKFFSNANVTKNIPILENTCILLSVYAPTNRNILSPLIPSLAAWSQTTIPSTAKYSS